jgi:hypothetical protein
MSRCLIRRIEETPIIQLRTRTEIVALEGNGHLERVQWRDGTGAVTSHAVKHVFLMTGAEANTGWLNRCVALDAKGFIKTGPDLTPEDLAAAKWPLERYPSSLIADRALSNLPLRHRGGRNDSYALWPPVGAGVCLERSRAVAVAAGGQEHPQTSRPPYRYANVELPAHFQSRIEMGQDLKRVVDTLARDAMYPALSRAPLAIGRLPNSESGRRSRSSSDPSCPTSPDTTRRARAQSAQDDFDNFTLQENRGKALFMRNCGACHMKDGNEHFFVPTPANTGLRRNDPTADGGVGDVTLRAADLISFKSPSLRNVEVTAPYGHDGRFATLDALIDH